MDKIICQATSKTYPVLVGQDILENTHGLLENSHSKTAFMISDNVLKSHHDKLMKHLESNGWSVHGLLVEAGESFKSLESVTAIYNKMLEAKLDRHSTLFALGGGSIGDACGFIASTYMRGIAWVGIPSTFLAQVDSAIGGKTAVNLAAGKNLMGTFHQPSAVICDTELLTSLSEREVVSGLGEVIKYGLIYDPKFYAFTQENWEKFKALDSDVVQQSVTESIKWKVKAVESDERDLLGIREALNFGHTFGHALESLTNYDHFQHGEAIIYGMKFALLLSSTKGTLPKKDCEEAVKFLSSIPLPQIPPNFSIDRAIEKMKNDKKAKNGQMRFVLLEKIGKAVSVDGITDRDCKKAFDLLNKGAHG